MLREEIEAMADPPNAVFMAKLVPTLDRATVLGIRNPVMRAFAKDLWRSRRDEALAFMADTPHHYFDENMLHAFLITQERDFDTCLARVDDFLPWVNNWATCDSMNPAALKKNPAALEEAARRWIDADHLYTRRYGVHILMNHFLGDNFRPELLDVVARVTTERYYLQMMVAWYFAEAVAKQPEAAGPYLLEEGHLPHAIRRKGIQKALESYRVDAELKDLLRQARTSIPRAPLAKPA